VGSLAENALVLFVDHQKGIVEGAKATDEALVDATAASLAKAAKLYDIPVIVSAVGLNGEPKLTHRLLAELGELPIYVRNGTDSLGDPAIAEAIERTGRKTLLICGVLTEVAVERPALSGVGKGYRVQVVLDACNGLSERSEKAAIERMTHSGVEMTSMPAVIGELAYDFGDPRAKDAFALMQS
jgi:nicotinamidase-related amidase